MQNATLTIFGQSCVASYQQIIPCHIPTHGQNSARTRPEFIWGKLRHFDANTADQGILEGSEEDSVKANF